MDKILKCKQCKIKVTSAGMITVDKKHVEVWHCHKCKRIQTIDKLKIIYRRKVLTK